MLFHPNHRAPRPRAQAGGPVFLELWLRTCLCAAFLGCSSGDTPKHDETLSALSASGLTAGYPFEEGTGTTTADVSVNAITGTLTNGPTWGTGKYGKGIVFDGVNDFVNLGNPTPLKITGSMTVSAWINSSAFPADDAAIVSKRNNGSLGFQLDTTVDRGPRQVGFKLTSSSGGSMFRYGATTLQLNTWYHVAGVYDATAKTLSVYLNGALDNGTLVGTVTASQQDSTQNVNLGRRSGQAGFEFKGTLDDVRIYSRALSAAEIQTDMNNSAGAAPDTMPPMVSVTAPAANAQLSGSVNVTANASDNTAVAGVQFLLDGSALGAEDTSSPYSVTWNTAMATNGSHMLSARARDNAGNMTTSAAVAVTVNNPPLLTISQPAEGAALVGTSVSVGYAVTGDTSQVSQVQFQLDGGTLVYDATVDGSFQLSSVPAGSHTLQAVLVRSDLSAIAGSGTTVHFTSSLPDTTPPMVSISSPAPNASVSGAISVSASASDNVGVAGVQFLLDGAALGAEVLGAPYAVTWDTRGASNGSHTLSARARDAAGNMATSAGVVVSVMNTATAGLTAGYAFDEGSGTSAADVSANAITGTLTNGPTWGTGKYGKAVVLDGSNDFVNLGNPTPLKITGSMTISAWINAAVHPGDDAAIVSKRNSGSVGFQLDTTVDSGPRTVGFKLTSSSGGSMFRYGNTVLATNTWYHVAGVYDASAKTLNVYVNGALDNGTLVGTITASQQDSTQNVNIGQRPGLAGFWFNGRIDDVRIYSRALSQAEVSADMNTSLGVAPDTTPPMVSISAPAANTQVAGTVTVSATASDDVGVAGVQFLLDGAPLGTEDTSAPYSVSWNATASANGSHTLSARARDAAGNMTTSAGVPVTVFNPPLLIIDQPAEGQTIASTTVDILYETSGDLSQVNHVHFTLDGGAVLTDTTLDGMFQLTGVAPGSHTLQGVLARADHTNITGSEATVHFTTSAPDTTPPSVSVTAPAANASVSGTISVSATASDNVAVAGVQFLLDGANLGAEILSGPYTLSWDSHGTANGQHTLTARARDAAGNTAQSAGVAFTVQNVLTVGLTAGYAFDEGTGTTAADVSANRINGTLVNSASWGSGRYGNALALDGHGYVDLGNPTPLKITGSMTVSGWIYPTVHPGDDAAIVSKRDSGVGFQLDTTIDQGPRTVGFKLTSSSNSNMFRYGTTALALNTWYHVAGVYDASARTLNVYVNGQLDNGALVGTVAAAQLDSAMNVNIGRRPGLTGFEFIGRVDDTRIYNRALSQAEIQSDMNTALGAPGDTAPPQVSLTAPAQNATVSALVNISANASDDTRVAGVQFFVDAAPLGNPLLSAPYQVSWDTRTTSNGTHTLWAQASDLAGHTTTSAVVTVQVNNTNFFQNEILIQGLALPTVLKFLPDGRLLIGLLGGQIVILRSGATAVDPTPFLSLTNIGTLNGQQGLMDILLDPNFATNGWYYIFYTHGNPNRDRVSRFTANGSTTDLSTELVLWQDDQDANAEHHGGALNFGNDGMLYVTTGENFQPAQAQSLSTYRGKILRINKDGTIPTDNPFNDGTGPNKEEIWALGLRNPYRAYWDLPSGLFFIGNVGGNDYSIAIEELNLGQRGANYGWPNCEGTCNNPAYVDPIYQYAHNGRDACITSGFVYHGSQFPSDYVGSYFFADYVQNWIKRATFDATGKITAVYNFEPLDGSVDGPWGDIVYMTEAPDGSLYYIDLGYEDSTGATDISKIRRIRYVQSNQAPIAIASAVPTSGPRPLTVQFSSTGSSDPEGALLTFTWDFGDNTSGAGPSPSHQYTANGSYIVRMTASDGVNTQLAPPLTIAVGSPPVPSISSPADGSKFRAGDVIAFAGDAVDAEDGTLPASAFSWQALFHHSTHVHPATPVPGVKSGTYVIPTSGHDFSGTTYYEFVLTVTDSDGLTGTKSVFIYPDKVNLSFSSTPSGLTLHIDGIPYTTPFVHDTLINFQHQIDAPDQTLGSTQYTFASWSDGGAWQHTITVPAADAAYSASFNQAAITLPPGLAAAYNLNASSGTTAVDGSGKGNTATLNGGGSWVSGVYGGGLHFDGTTGYLSVPNSPTLDIAGTALTLAMWINLDATSNVDSVVLGKFWNAASMASPYYQYGLELSAGREPYFYVGTSGGAQFGHLGSNLATGVWTHLAVVFDGANVVFYVNGTATTTQALPASMVARGNPVAIGADNAPQQFLRGSLDEVRIYQRALSASEVQTDMNTAF